MSFCPRKSVVNKVRKYEVNQLSIKPGSSLQKMIQQTNNFRMSKKVEDKGLEDKSQNIKKAGINNALESDDQKDVKITLSLNDNNSKESFLSIEPTQRQLQEAIIWSEILGKPLSKRRKRS